MIKKVQMSEDKVLEKKMNKEILYKRFWLFAICFTAFWLLYGTFELVRSLMESEIEKQSLYLMIGTLPILYQSISEYKKSKNRFK